MTDFCDDESFKKLSYEFQNKNIRTKDPKYQHFIDDFNLFENELLIEEKIKNNISESKLMIINNLKACILVCFEKTIIFFKKSSLTKFHSFFQNNQNLPIYFIGEEQNENEINIPNPQYKFENPCEIGYFANQFHTNLGNNELLKHVKKSIIGYLIKKSYYQLNDRQQNFSFNEDILETDYVILRSLGYGSSFKVDLIYHLRTEKLFALKRPNKGTSENEELLEREINNYKVIDYPHVPKFYGIVKDEHSLIIQFINGQTLDKLKQYKLNDEDKILIIFQIIMIINHLHENQFVYRDLKPDNIMIDENKNVFIIDFDQMKKYFSFSNEKQEHTKDFNSLYVAPEIFNGELSYKSDVFSIGKIIYFIMNEKQPNVDPSINEFTNEEMKQLYQKCIDTNCDSRYSIRELIFNFVLYFSSQIKDTTIQDFPEIEYFLGLMRFDENYVKTDINDTISLYLSAENHPRIQNYLGLIYKKGQYVKKDLFKALKYFECAAQQNDRVAQFNLGIIYFQKEDINKAFYYYKLSADQNYPQAQNNLAYIYEKYENDIKNAIYYYKLAADQNNPEALFNLGIINEDGKHIMKNINNAIRCFRLSAELNFYKAQYKVGKIYSNGKHVEKDIGKSIHYFTLAANQNYPKAQFRLGVIYYENIFVKRDIEKSISYFELAANQDYPKAQFELGVIYYESNFVQRDIKKSISYFELAANQNHPIAQFNLGLIYSENEYIKRDIRKAIDYYTLSANQNFSEAQLKLGEIYFDSDIEKSIYYFELAANQDHPIAQFNLGLIYSENEYIKRDIDKAIEYYTLSANQKISEAQFKLGEIYEKVLNPKDINKAIHYYTLASKNGNSNAQFNLGALYYKGNFVVRDIYKSIYFLKLAANQNHPIAQFNLGYIYSESEYIEHDIDKAIRYYTLSANQNYEDALNSLGIIYEEGRYVKKDINKAIEYYSRAGELKHKYALYNIGYIYDKGNGVPKDMKKAVDYYKKAAHLGHSEAQYYIGLFYMLGYYIDKNYNLGINYLVLASKNNYHDAFFVIGYFYHEGKYQKRDIRKAIYYYRKSSSYNDQFAKNNLGIIFKHGIEKEIGQSIFYFEESINRFNDVLSLYNLAHFYIFIYKEISNDSFDSIELLIKSSDQNFYPAKELLCIALIKKNGFDLNQILNDVNKNYKNCIIKHKCNDFINELYQIIKEKNLENEFIFNEKYKLYEEIDYYYNLLRKPIQYNKFLRDNISYTKITGKSINEYFYEGFGNDILK